MHHINFALREATVFHGPRSRRITLKKHREEIICLHSETVGETLGHSPLS